LFLWQRITIPEILVDEWFKKGYKPPVFEEKEDTNLDDVEAVFKDSEVSFKMIILYLYQKKKSTI
jgi:hypothetical protein